MNLSQRKLNKSEWESVEIPVSQDEKTIIIVTKPNNERANMLLQLFICNKSIFLARKAKIKRIGNE